MHVELSIGRIALAIVVPPIKQICG